MTQITLQDGKLILRDGKIGTEQECCCGPPDEPDEPPIMGCCGQFDGFPPFWDPIGFAFTLDECIEFGFTVTDIDSCCQGDPVCCGGRCSEFP